MNSFNDSINMDAITFSLLAATLCRVLLLRPFLSFLWLHVFLYGPSGSSSRTEVIVYNSSMLVPESDVGLYQKRIWALAIYGYPGLEV